MKKSERLELENKVLKNMLENIQCEIEQYYQKDCEDRFEPHYLIGRIQGITGSFDGRMEHAAMFGYLEYSPVRKGNLKCIIARNRSFENGNV